MWGGWGGGCGDEGGENVGSSKDHRNDKMPVKFSSGRLYCLKSPIKISLKHDWIRVKVDETPS